MVSERSHHSAPFDRVAAAPGYLAAAHEELSSLRRWLVDPSEQTGMESWKVIEAVGGLMIRAENAVNCGELDQKDVCNLRESLAALRRDYKGVRALLHQAYRFHSFWAQLALDETQTSASYDSSGNSPSGLHPERTQLEVVIHG